MPLLRTHVAAGVGISDAQASRLLAQLEQEGRIERLAGWRFAVRERQHRHEARARREGED